MIKELSIFSPSRGEGIYQRGEDFFLALDSQGSVKVPKEWGRLIRAALYSQMRLRRNQGDYQKTKENYWNLNCHKTVLIALGLIPLDDVPSGKQAIRLMNKRDFKMLSPADAEQYVRDSLKGGVGIVQMGGKDGSRVTHTALAGVDSLGRVVCFEKYDVWGHPFRIIPFSEVFDRDYYVAAQPIERFERAGVRNRLAKSVEHARETDEPIWQPKSRES